MHIGDTMEEAEKVAKRRMGRGRKRKWEKGCVRANISSTLPSCTQMMCEKLDSYSFFQGVPGKHTRITTVHKEVNLFCCVIFLTE